MDPMASEVPQRSSEPARALRVVRLAGGALLTIRQAAPGDEARLDQLYRGLSLDDRHLRFFSGAYLPPKQVLHDWVRAAEQGTGARLVAVLDDGRFVGDAGYFWLGDERGDAEFDITVATELRGWLGPYLLDVLVDVAAADGVGNLQADILFENRPMRALIRSRGYVTIQHEDHTAFRVLIGVRDAMPHWPAGGPGDRVLVEARGGDWHAADTARANGLQVAVCPGPRNTPGCPALAGRPCPLVTEADAVVFALPLDDPEAARLLRAHPDLHPDTILCVEPVLSGHPDRDPVAREEEVAVALPSGAVRLDEDPAVETDAIIRALGHEPRLPPRPPRENDRGHPSK